MNRSGTEFAVVYNDEEISITTPDRQGRVIRQRRRLLRRPPATDVVVEHFARSDNLARFQPNADVVLQPRNDVGALFVA